MKLSVILFFFIVQTLPTVSPAKEIFVDNIHGNDTSNGITRLTPVMSFKSAISLIEDGDVLFIISNGPKHPYRQMFSISGGKYSKGIQVVGVNRPYITGSINLSVQREYMWSHVDNGVWKLLNTSKIKGLMLSNKEAWNNSGVDALQRLKSSTSKKLNIWEWYYNANKDFILIKLPLDKKPEDFHIEGIRLPNLFVIDAGSNITVSKINLVNSSNDAFLISGNSTHIILNGIGVKHAMNNGIMVIDGGNDIRVENCVVDQVNNSGVKFRGDPDNHVSNTYVVGCIISNIFGNDAITYHKDKGYHDIGSFHLAQNNVLYNCNEDGIDVTSGSNIHLKNNTTFSNRESGVLVNHWAKNVLIENHLSINDGKKNAGIKILHSSNVKLSNSLIMGSRRHHVFMKNNDAFVATHNIFIATGMSSDSLIKQIGTSRNNLFLNNIIISNDSSSKIQLFFSKLEYVENKINGRNVGFPEGGKSRITSQMGTVFTDNLWWSVNRHKKEFQDKSLKQKIFSISELPYMNDGNIYKNPFLKLTSQGQILPQSSEIKFKFGYNGNVGATLPEGKLKTKILDLMHSFQY